MTDSNAPRLSKIPFLLGDLVLIGLAGFIFIQGHRPNLLFWEAALIIGCILAGAYCTMLPFLREYEQAVKLSEADRLVSVVNQIQNLELVSGQITSTAAQLQSAIDASNQTVAAADQIAQRMAEEARQFAEFMQKASDSEKAHLRLEVEKLRRTEGDWLQVVVRVLDHTYAVNLAATRSGQRPLIDQLNQFQNACRDVARRVGLAAFSPAPGDGFDAKSHQVIDGQPPASAGMVIGEVVATGYTFQGQQIRPALVALKAPSTPITGPQPAEPGPADEPEEPTLL